MNRAFILVGGLAAVLATAAVGKQTTEATTAAAQPSPTDDQAIRLLDDRFAKAYNAGDAKAVAALFVANGEIVNQAGEAVQGQKSIVRVFSRFFQAHPKSKIVVSIESIRLLNATTAVDVGTSTVTAPSGQTIEQNRYVVVYSKQDNEWKMAIARDLPNEQSLPTKEIKDLQWLIGNWADETPGATVVTSYRSADGGRSILSNFRVQIGGRSAMTGTERIAWDPQAGKLRSWTHDSKGGYAEGTWTRNGDRWVVKRNGMTADGLRASSTNTLTRVTKDRMIWQSSDRVVGGKTLPNIDPFVVVREAPTPQ
jgi:uncharacterized protein (TIGR02246 family)